MTGAMPSTPFNALNYITNTPHIISFLQGEAAKGACRLQGYGDWSRENPPKTRGTILAHTTINNSFLSELDIPKRHDMDLTTPVLNLDRNFNVTTPGVDTTEYRNSLPLLIENIQPDTIECYTDGSKTDTGCGSGYIITTDNNKVIIIEIIVRFSKQNYQLLEKRATTSIMIATNTLSSGLTAYRQSKPLQHAPSEAKQS